MPEHQLEVSAALLAASAFSALLHVLFRPQEEKIALPIARDEELDASHDPFDVTKPEDVIDGFPIEETEFWLKVKYRKIAMTILLGLVCAINAIAIGFAAVNEDKHDILLYSLSLAASVYALILVVRSISWTTVLGHTHYTMHISILTAFNAVVLVPSVILPSSPPPTTASEPSIPYAALSYLWIAETVLYSLVCVIAFTTPIAPRYNFPPRQIYSPNVVEAITNQDSENVCGSTGASIWDALLFSYSTKVVMLGNTAEQLEVGDLPVVPADMRSAFQYARMKAALKSVRLRIRNWTPAVGSGWNLAWQMASTNLWSLFTLFFFSAASAILFYVPYLFLQQVVKYLENDPERKDIRWGLIYSAGLFSTSVLCSLLTGQLWSIATTTIQVRMKIQLNSVLYRKTLVRKDIASSASTKKDGDDAASGKDDDETAEDDFSSKAQVMNLMTTDVDRVSDFAWHMFTLIDAPIELAISTVFLYNLLGVSCFFGLAVTFLFLPLNHFAGKIVVNAQDNLMKARDERVSLMNEILAGIRMLKFMAWERSFEKKVLKVRAKELKYQKLNYTIEILWNGTWNALPILVTLVSFWHFTVVRGLTLTPSIAFTSIAVFSEMKFALSALPETFVNMLQSFVSLRRIEKYLNGAEVKAVPPLAEQSRAIAFQSATVTWPQDRTRGSQPNSVAPTPRQKFILSDLSLSFPLGELSLVCGKLGSGKTLLLLSLLGEADLLAGQVLCPRSPPDTVASFDEHISPKNWVIDGICAYVPQAAWLRNASIKENILFDLPLDEERYNKTLEACALVSDLKIIEDGDEAEIGERGVNLSGGQKARVSLARAVYSRASVLFLDDVLSAVDAHTAHHLFHKCLKGDLMKGRTLILVSHHVQMCAPGAKYIVALDNGSVAYEGAKDKFLSSSVMNSLIQSQAEKSTEEKQEAAIEELVEPQAESSEKNGEETSETSTAISPAPTPPTEKKKPRKLMEEEKRAVGRISKDVWATYLKACGGPFYWSIFIFALVISCFVPVADNGWLKIWSGASPEDAQDPTFYIGVYTVITLVGLVITTSRWFALYRGSIHASILLYERLLETVLFANIRFHDTVSRGRLLNRFGKDFEGVDSSLSDNLGRSTMYMLSTVTTFVTIIYVGGWPFFALIVVIAIFYARIARVYSQTSRDMRRLDSVTRSPLYSIYGETISGVTVLRAFGASSKFLRDMLRNLDTNSCSYYWMWGVNRWLSIRFNLLSNVVEGTIAIGCIMMPGISASLAGFALAFSTTVTNDLLFLVRRFVSLEQSMVAVERIKEYTELVREAPAIIEPRPPASWPSEGSIECEDLVIQYAPDLPAVLHNVSFTVKPGEKIGVLGRTGSGKSTLALSFFRFVEATQGRIVIDGIDISKIGLSDLRSKLTIIPQDPTILSGTLRSTLDVFDEYEDADIYESLRRVHLIPVGEATEEEQAAINTNVFRDLESPVSEGGENFSTGEKQLLCMARAILKRSKVLVMDEATASVDYFTDELISKTIRQEFASSTILTIAHRLRTIIDYDRVMLLDQGRIVEFDKPSVLINDTSSHFYGLCKATGSAEFAMLKQMASANSSSSKTE